MGRFFFANATRSSEFKSRLRGLVDEMNREYLKQVSQVYIEPYSFDGISSIFEQQIFNRILADFERKFYIASQEESLEIARTTLSGSRKNLRNYLRKLGITVRPTIDEVTLRQIGRNLQATLNDVVSIPKEYLNETRDILVEATARGRDFEYAVKEITKAKIDTKHSADLFVRDHINRLNENISTEVCKDAGITKFTWLHIPGTYSSRETHIGFNGQLFDIDEGLYDENAGMNVVPGQLRYCNCTKVPYIADIVG